MNDNEVVSVIGYLSAAYPNMDWGTGRVETMKIWRNILSVFPYKIGMEAAERYVRSGDRFFPVVSVFGKLCDDIWKKAIEKQRNAEANREWHNQLPPSDSGIAFGKKACANIVDLCNGAVTRREFIERGKQNGMDMSAVESFYTSRDLDLDKQAAMTAPTTNKGTSL